MVSNIYDLPRCKIFADNKFLFSEAIKYILKFNKDLKLISQHWAYQWKMLFNPNSTKQAIEMCF